MSASGKALRAAAWLAMGLVMAGCAENPITGRSQFLVVSEEQAIAASATAYREMIGQLQQKKRIGTGTARAARVREVADRLIVQAKRLRPDSASWQWEVNMKTRAASGLKDFDVLLEQAAQRAPLRRLGTPLEVGAAAAFLASDAGAAMTGNVIHVDAGYHVLG